MVNGTVSLISLSVFSLLVYRNARDFWVLIYILQLYYSHWLLLVIFWWVFRVFYVEDHVTCKQWQFYFSFAYFHLISLLFLISYSENLDYWDLYSLKPLIFSSIRIWCHKFPYKHLFGCIPQILMCFVFIIFPFLYFPISCDLFFDT